MSNNHIQIVQTHSHRPFENQRPAVIISEVIIRCLRILSSATRIESTIHCSVQYVGAFRAAWSAAALSALLLRL